MRGEQRNLRVAGADACPLPLLLSLSLSQVRAQSLRPLFAPGLYAGSGPSLLLKAAHGAAYMPLYFSVKGALLGLLPAPVVASVAAAAATLATAAVEVPAEALLLRLKRGGGAAGGFVGAARLALASRASFAALFAGAAPFVARHVLFEATEFAVFEAAKAKAKARARSDLHAGQGAGDDAGGGAVPLREAALAASLAGAAATLASHPLDCLRVAASLGGHGGGALGAARAILAASGPAGFAAGLAPRLAATVPASVLFFVVFEAALEGLTARGV